MNGRLIGLAVLLIGALAAGLSYLRTPDIEDSHRRARQITLYFTLSRADDPVILLGDSIVEASTLPRSLCGHPIVNAGLNRASTASDLGTWLLEVLDGKKAAAIIVSLGMNDALTARSAQQFDAAYTALLSQLSKATTRMFVLAVSPIDVLGRMTAERQAQAMGRIDEFNSMLPELAKKNGATFVALPPMPTPHTIDGVHMNAAGNSTWESAVLQGASTICNSN